MGLQSKKILGIGITISPKTEILEEIRKYLVSDNKKQITDNKKSKESLIIFTPNPEIITYAQKDKEFRQIVNSAQINLPDSRGVVWAIKKLYRINIEQIAGADFFFDLCYLANRESFTVGLIGGREGVALDTRECLLRSYPKLKVEVLEAPAVIVSRIRYQVSSINDKKIPNTKYLILNTEEKQIEETEKYFQNLAEKIIKREIDILFVALGFPKQEYFIRKIKNQISKIKDCKPLVLIAVGGSFDYLSGRIPRAPEWVRDKGWEWLFRLIKEPGRLPRQMKGAEFFWRVLTRYHPESR